MRADILNRPLAKKYHFLLAHCLVLNYTIIRFHMAFEWIAINRPRRHDVFIRWVGIWCLFYFDVACQFAVNFSRQVEVYLTKLSIL